MPPNPDRAGIDGTGTGALNFERTASSSPRHQRHRSRGRGRAGRHDRHAHPWRGGGGRGAGHLRLPQRRRDRGRCRRRHRHRRLGPRRGGRDGHDGRRLAELRAEETYFNIHTNRDTPGSSAVRSCGMAARATASTSPSSTSATWRRSRRSPPCSAGALISSFLDGEGHAEARVVASATSGRAISSSPRTRRTNRRHRRSRRPLRR